MNKKLVIANWKMNLNMHESSIFLHNLSEKVKIHRNMEVILAPSLFTLQSLSLQVNHRQFKLAAQNFTGVIKGHSRVKWRFRSCEVLCNMRLLVIVSGAINLAKLTRISGRKWQQPFVTKFGRFCV